MVIWCWVLSAQSTILRVGHWCIMWLQLYASGRVEYYPGSGNYQQIRWASIKLWLGQSVFKVWQRCDQSAVVNCGCGQWLPGPPTGAIFSATPGCFSCLGPQPHTEHCPIFMMVTYKWAECPRAYEGLLAQNMRVCEGLWAFNRWLGRLSNTQFNYWQLCGLCP